MIQSASAGKASIILASDESGLVPVFGIPVIRRLLLLAHQSWVEPIYLVGCVDPYRVVQPEPIFLLSSYGG